MFQKNWISNRATDALELIIEWSRSSIKQCAVNVRIGSLKTCKTRPVNMRIESSEIDWDEK